MVFYTKKKLHATTHCINRYNASAMHIHKRFHRIAQTQTAQRCNHQPEIAQPIRISRSRSAPLRAGQRWPAAVHRTETTVCPPTSPCKTVTAIASSSSSHQWAHTLVAEMAMGDYTRAREHQCQRDRELRSNPSATLTVSRCFHRNCPPQTTADKRRGERDENDVEQDTTHAPLAHTSRVEFRFRAIYLRVYTATHRVPPNRLHPLPPTPPSPTSAFTPVQSRACFLAFVPTSTHRSIFPEGARRLHSSYSQSHTHTQTECAFERVGASV